MTANDTPQPGAEGNFRPGILRQAFDAEYLPPPPGGWQALQEALPKPKRRWPFWWAGAMVALLGTVLGIFSLRDAMPKRTSIATETSAAESAYNSNTAPTRSPASVAPGQPLPAAQTTAAHNAPGSLPAQGAQPNATQDAVIAEAQPTTVAKPAARRPRRLQAATLALAPTPEAASLASANAEATTTGGSSPASLPEASSSTAPHLPSTVEADAATQLVQVGSASGSAGKAIGQSIPAASEAATSGAQAYTSAASDLAELATRLPYLSASPLPAPGAVATVPTTVTPTVAHAPRTYTLEAGLHALIRQRDMALAQRTDLTALAWDPAQPQPSLGLQAFANAGYLLRPGLQLGAGLGLGGWQDVLRLQMAHTADQPVVEQHVDGSIGTHLVHQPAQGHTLRWTTLQAHGELWGRLSLAGSPLSLQAGGGLTLLQPLGRADGTPQQTLALPHLLLALRYQRGPLFYEAGMRRMPRQSLAVPGLVQVQYQLFHVGVGFSW